RQVGRGDRRQRRRSTWARMSQGTPMMSKPVKYQVTATRSTKCGGHARGFIGSSPVEILTTRNEIRQNADQATTRKLPQSERNRRRQSTCHDATVTANVRKTVSAEDVGP